MNEPTDALIDAALLVWAEEGELPYAARMRDFFPDEPMPEGPEKDAALAALRAADTEAWEQNRALMRKVAAILAGVVS